MARTRRDWRASPRGAPARAFALAERDSGPWTKREDHHQDEHDVQQPVAVGTPRTIGKVASTIGTAPRSPAQERNACSRNGTRNGDERRDHRQRPREREAGPGRRRVRATSSRGSWCGIDEQAEQDEQSDLGEPAEALGEGPRRGPVRQPGVGQDQRGEVGGEETAGVRGAGGGEREDAQPERRERVEPGRGQGDPGQRDRARASRTPSPIAAPASELVDRVADERLGSEGETASR